MPTKTSDQLLPPYIPWKSFAGHIEGFQGTTVPHKLDGSVRPPTTSGGVWRQLVSALRFLGLIGEDNVVSEAIQSLVAAYGTDEWPAAVKEHVVPAYGHIVRDLPIETATSSMLNERFIETGCDGQMLEKCVRFYLYALKESGTAYSQHLSIRERKPRKKSTSQKPKKKSAQKTRSENESQGETELPVDFVKITIPIVAPGAFVYVPRTLTPRDLRVVKATFNLVEAMAEEKK